MRTIGRGRARHFLGQSASDERFRVRVEGLGLGKIKRALRILESQKSGSAQSTKS